jgi:2-C-methyl-D-erythritol 2,4-cyclodiphosphate synthase
MTDRETSFEDEAGSEEPYGLSIRIGHGWDRHRLEPLTPSGMGRLLVIGGVPVDHDQGPVARSDGDVLLHAVTDALLGALGEADIGQLFPDTDIRNEGRDSAEFVTRAMQLIDEAGWRVGNLDATVVLERPRLATCKDPIRQNLARLLGVEVSAVNVKGKTGEGVDAVGEGRAIEAHAVVLLMCRSAGVSS